LRFLARIFVFHASFSTGDVFPIFAFRCCQVSVVPPPTFCLRFFLSQTMEAWNVGTPLFFTKEWPSPVVFSMFQALDFFTNNSWFETCNFIFPSLKCNPLVADTSLRFHHFSSFSPPSLWASSTWWRFFLSPGNLVRVFPATPPFDLFCCHWVCSTRMVVCVFLASPLVLPGFF